MSTIVGGTVFFIGPSGVLLPCLRHGLPEISLHAPRPWTTRCFQDCAQVDYVSFVDIVLIVYWCVYASIGAFRPVADRRLLKMGSGIFRRPSRIQAGLIHVHDIVHLGMYVYIMMYIPRVTKFIDQYITIIHVQIITQWPNALQGCGPLSAPDNSNRPVSLA
jgi:hypothetical protein